MFESLIEAAAEDTAQIDRLRKRLLAMPAAFSVLCCIAFYIAEKLDIAALFELVFWGWLAGSLSIAVVSSGLAMGKGKPGLALLAWIYGALIAWASSVAGFFILVAIRGMH